MKAWVVGDRQEEHAVIVYAEKRSKAISLGIRHFSDTTYIEARCRRAPEFDAGHPNNETLVREHGWHFDCRCCWRLVYNSDLDERGAVFDQGPDEHPLCGTCAPGTAACCAQRLVEAST